MPDIFSESTFFFFFFFPLHKSYLSQNCIFFLISLCVFLPIFNDYIKAYY